MNLLVLLSEDPSLLVPGLQVSPGSLRQHEPDADIARWPDGADGPETWIGRDRQDPSGYAIFGSVQKLQAAGFEYVASSYVQAHRFDKLDSDLKSQLLQASSSAAR